MKKLQLLRRLVVVLFAVMHKPHTGGNCTWCHAHRRSGVKELFDCRPLTFWAWLLHEMTWVMSCHSLSTKCGLPAKHHMLLQQYMEAAGCCLCAAKSQRPAAHMSTILLRQCSNMEA
jgi:hypothetical protein